MDANEHYDLRGRIHVPFPCGNLRLDDPGWQVRVRFLPGGHPGRRGLAFRSSRSLGLLLPSVPIYIGIYKYLGVRRLGVLRIELGRRGRFGRGRLFFRFVGGLPTGEESFDHIKGDWDEEDGDG